MPEEADKDTLQSELLNLRQMTQRIKHEINIILNPSDETNHFQRASEQLNAINQATEEATQTIIEAAEHSDMNIAALRSIVGDNVDAEVLLSAMTLSTQKLYEACTFQDITGQRAGKIIASLGYVEERMISIAALLDGDTLNDTTAASLGKTEADKLLEGPQHEGKGLKQSDVDALFD